MIGQAMGTASGVAPLAYLAIYKVCYQTRRKHNETIVMKVPGMDTAISDEVDVLSTSVGFGGPRPFHADNIAIGAFSIMQRGIFASCAAGNNRPKPYSLSNEAPYMLSHYCC